MDQIGKINGFAALLGCLLIGVMAGSAVEESPSAASRFAGADNKAAPDFQKHVVPLLGKLGCSSAKCHGSFQGQGDFRLSLFGFGFQKDHAALVAEASSEDGHRISPELPAQSLILLKPTKQIKHRGGKIFEKDSWEYNLLHRWIETGAKGVQITPAAQVPQVSQPEFSKAGIQFFEDRIRPLLENNCYECHGFNKRKGDLQLKSREDALLGGGSGKAAIVPEDIEKSLLIEAVRHTNPDLQMPPKRKLEDREIADLEQWISIGAPWPNASDLAPVKSGKKLAQLHYEPQEILFQSTEDTAQIRIVAEWEDGKREDVTCLTRFRTNNDAVAAVNESGLAKSTGHYTTMVLRQSLSCDRLLMNVWRLMSQDIPTLLIGLLWQSWLNLASHHPSKVRTQNSSEE